MTTIILNNSYSQVTNLEPKYWPGLRKKLSYQTDLNAAYYGGFGPKTYYLVDKKGNFPSGLFRTVENYLVACQIPYIVDDQRRRPNAAPYPTKPSSLPLYPYQKDALNQCIINTRGIVSMPTGSGKSMVIASIVLHYDKLKTLIVVPTLELKSQLIDMMKVFKAYTKNLVVENIDSTNLSKLKDFDILIIDEAHHVAAKTYQRLNKMNWGNIYYRYFLTATPFRNQQNEQLLFESIAGELIYELSYLEAVKSTCIVPVKSYYIDLQKAETEARTWKQVYDELVIHNETRNAAICTLCIGLKEKPILILVKEIAHGKILSNQTDIPFVNGQDEESRKYIKQFNEGKIKALIGTNGILGEGVDTKPCEFVVIAGLGKAKSAFMQQVGRAVRKYPGKDYAKVIIFRDTSHKFTRNHFNEQKKILKEEYGSIPIKLNIP